MDLPKESPAMMQCISDCCSNSKKLVNFIEMPVKQIKAKKIGIFKYSIPFTSYKEDIERENLMFLE